MTSHTDAAPRMSVERDLIAFAVLAIIIWPYYIGVAVR